MLDAHHCACSHSTTRGALQYPTVWGHSSAVNTFFFVLYIAFALPLLCTTMPRQRQRIVFCDCYDCVDRPATATLSPEGLKAAEAVARQEPPPKGLVILASGFLVHQEGQLNLDACTLPHLNRLVHEGNLGFLASRQGATGKFS